jgi:hypothetical protein
MNNQIKIKFFGLTLSLISLFSVLIFSETLSMGAQTETSPRKGQLNLSLTQSNGNPLSYAMVNYTQESNDFLFGVGMTGPQGPLPNRLFPEFRKMGVNFLMPCILWADTEPTQGLYNWQGCDTYNLTQLQQLGYTNDGQLMIFFFDQDWCMPQYIKNMTFNQLLSAVDSHAYTVASHYAGVISLWDLNEISDPRSNYFNFTQQQWIDIVRTAGQAIKRADPNAKIMINLVIDDHYGWTPQGFLDALNNNHVDYDVIGLEIYNWMVSQDANGYANITECVDKIHTFDRFNKPVIITEIAIPDIPSQTTQADWLTSFYSTISQIPSVKGICYYYTVDDGGLTSGLYPNANSQPRLIYYALGDAIKSMTSSGTSIANEQGTLSVEGYAGNYSIKVTYDGKTYEVTTHITEGEAKNVAFTLPAETTPTPTPTPVPETPTFTMLTLVFTLVAVLLLTMRGKAEHKTRRS